MSITISIVSHGHGDYIEALVDQILPLHEISKIIITLNIPEKILLFNSSKIVYINNVHAKGFAENHNYAFKLCTTKYFAIMNPDIKLINNPYPYLINLLKIKDVSLAAPLILNEDGNPADSIRRFPTILSLIKRFLKIDPGLYIDNSMRGIIYPDWVGGMFMLFLSQEYELLNGLDERFFIYCEDIDICARVWLKGNKVAVSTEATVVHYAQRASHSNLKHFYWHLKSLTKFFIKYKFRKITILRK